MRGLIAAVLCLAAAPGLAQQPGSFPADGPAIYRTACQGCHMPQGQGAVGAGTYPALAANPRLDPPDFAILTILAGRRAMPAMGRFLSDAQVAAVVGFIRTGLGNDFRAPVSPADVARLR